MAAIQSWLMIEGNVVTGRCQWDGDTATWAPPVGVTMVRDPGGVGVGYVKKGGKFVAPPEATPPVPSSVTNYQARAVMRMTPMPDGRSLLEAVRSSLKADLDRVQPLPDMDPERVTAEVAWEAWEQANVYERNGPLVSSLASRFGLSDAMTDDLFRQAEQVTA